MRPRERDTLSVWQVVELARHPERPYSLDYIRRMAPDFIELHGDRVSHDDPALVAGLGTWRGLTTVFLPWPKSRLDIPRQATAKLTTRERRIRHRCYHPRCRIAQGECFG